MFMNGWIKGAGRGGRFIRTLWNFAQTEVLPRIENEILSLVPSNSYLSNCCFLCLFS